MNKLSATAIENLKTLGEKTGQNLLAQLAKMYMDTTPEVIINMRTMLANLELNDLQREAHSLKSSSMNLGAEQTALVAKEIEYYIYNDSSPTVEKIDLMITKLDKEFQNILPELKSLKDGIIQ